MAGHRQATTKAKVKKSRMTYNEARTAIGQASRRAAKYANITALVQDVNANQNGSNTELTEKMAEKALRSMNIPSNGEIKLR